MEELDWKYECSYNGEKSNTQRKQVRL
eukprot:COSAG02_NODE_42311_length_385_cov_1.531469_1_plen_26_part_01